MFVAAKIQYSPIKIKFNSFNTDNKSIRKTPKVSFVKKAKLTPNLPSNTRGPLRENYGTPRENNGAPRSLGVFDPADRQS